MKKLAQIALLATLLLGCSVGAMIPSPTSSDDAATPTVTTIPPTITMLPSIPEATSTLASRPISAPTVIYNQNAGVGSKCVDVSQDVPTGQTGNGVAVLEDQRIVADSLAVPGFFLLNMKTGTSTNLSKQDGWLFDGSVSPDRTLLSIKAGFSKLLIMQSDGKIIKELPVETGWGGAIWLDNQHLIMSIAEPALDENNKLTVGKMLWLNPITGERRILVLDFPKLFWNPSSAWAWEDPWGKNPVVLNPSLTRAVYLAEPGNKYVLWDTQNKKALIDWVSIDINHHPHWSPDGSKFLMDVSDPSDNPGNYSNGLYLVDDNGHVSIPVLLTYAESHIAFTDYFWSPSGRYVALRAIASENSKDYSQKLLILDVQTRQIADYCVEFTPSGIGDSYLIWSPDETQILLNDQYSQDHSRVILVDLVEKIAFPIAEDVIATGWMKALP